MLFRVLVIALAMQLSGCAALFVAGVATTVMVADDPRTLGTQIDDQNIESKAYNRIAKDKSLGTELDVSVTSYNGVVLLTGHVASQQQANAVVDIMRNLQKVRVIHNELKIGSKAESMEGLSDATITTKVKSLMALESDLSSNHIKVITESSEVYLMGLVDKPTADKAVAVTRKASGVSKVVDLFEIKR